MKLFLRFKLIVIIIFLSFSSAKAEHIAGGDLDVQWISGNDYRVTLKLFRDCANGGAPFDNSVTITVRDNATNSQVTSFSMSLKTSTNLSLGDDCFSPPSSVCMQEGIYTQTVTLANNPNGYYMAWERCCRSPLNLNLVQDQAMVFYAQVADPALKNSSPKFGTYPTNGYMCINEKNYFNFNVTDVNGDELRYSLVTPLRGSATGTGNPVSTTAGSKPYAPISWRSPYNLSNIVGGTPNMSIDPTTGIITCSPTSIGAFTFAVLVEEFRNGVKIGEIMRDIQFFALNCQKQVASINQTPTTDDTALEGCIKASFKFNLSKSLSKDTTICYEIKGNATNGVDYAFVDDCITIPAGQTYGTIVIDAFADGLTEGKEDIYLIYNPIPCVDFVKDTVFLYIDDAQPIDYSLDKVNLTCNGDFTGQIDADITGGFAPYVITVTPNGGDPTTYSSANLPITGLAAGTYTVEIDDIYGCAGESEVVGALFDAGQTFLPDGNGQIFTTTLTIGGVSTPVLTSPEELQSVCINMEHSSLGDIGMRLISPNGTMVVLKQRFNGNDGGHTDLGEPVAKNQTDGGNASEITPGIGYDYCFNATPTYGTMVAEQSNYQHTYVDQLGTTLTDDYLPAGSYTSYETLDNFIGSPINGDWTIEIEDYRPQSNGYIFNWSMSFKVDKSGDVVTLTEPDPINVSLNGAVTKASCNGTDGEIDITVNGTFPPFDFLWSNSAITEDISGLAAGTYSVVVTDNNGCSITESFDVPNATGPAITASIQNEKCFGSNDGFIDATIATTGTITNISWSNSAITEDIAGLTPGDYTITAADDIGCKSVETFTVSPATQIKITGTVINERCGNKEGEIDITVTGGAGGYIYSWSNTSNSEDLTDLNQNTYTVTVTDANNCSVQKSFSVINEVGQCTPNCDLVINSSNVTNETCGNANGAINLSIFSSNTPILVNWGNGMSGNSITGLAAGTYTATITDLEGCEIIQDYTVSNNSGTLSITNPIIINEACGNASGSIDITVNGGAGGYIYTWSNSATTQDISSISAGTYSVTVEDAAGCKTTASNLIVGNDANGIAINLNKLTNETCGNGKGAIDISVTPPGSYTYLWSNSAITQDLSNLTSGTYSVVVTNSANGCKLTSQDFVISNASGTLSVIINDTDNEICGNNAGEIDLTISGGAPSYNILWNNSATSEDLTNLSAGTYSATITDQNGCTTSTGDIIIQNTPGNLSVNASVVDEICGNSQGAVNLTVTGGTPLYSYSWSNSAITKNISGLASGSYSYTVSDQNGCSVNSSVTVANNPGTLSIDNVSITDTDCNSTNGAIDISVSGGDGNYTFNWSNSSTSEDLSGVSQGSYTISVEDGAGCIVNKTYDVQGYLTLTSANISGDLCGRNVGTIDIELSGGTNYTYKWNTGATSQDINNLSIGTYSVDVTSFEGCTYINSFDVGDDPSCNQICSSVYSNSVNGTIYDSGGASKNYSNDETCGFLIQPDCANQITLSFSDFRTESNADFLIVYDGTDNTGTQLLRASGTSIPSAVVANSGAMFIQYSSDIAVNERGFIANWSSTVHSNLPTASFTVPSVSVPFGAPVVFTSTSQYAFTWSWDVNNDGLEDYNTENITHTFTSPGTYTVTLTVENCNGSDTYSLDIIVDEIPEITLSPSTTIDINIDDCNTQETTFTIGNIGAGQLVWNIYNTSPLIINPSNGNLLNGESESLTVTIPAYTTTGTFTESFKINSNDPITPSITVTINIIQTANCINTMCVDNVTTMQSGILYDSGGEFGNYTDDEICSFLINPDCAEEITLSFEEFDVEEFFDYLYVYDGTNTSGTLLLIASGSTIPSPITAKSGSMYLVFTSDIFVALSGFKARWNSVITPDVPIASFSVTNSTEYIGTTINFTNTSENGSTYAWDINNDNVTDYTSANISIAFDTPGVYQVKLTVTNCLGSDTYTQEITILDGVDPSKVEPLPFRIFPNPTYGEVGIDLPTKEFVLDVYNELGQKVNFGLQKISDYQYIVDISELSKSTYVFRLNGEPYKIVKLD